MAERPSNVDALGRVIRGPDTRMALPEGEHSFLTESQLKDLAALYMYGSKTGMDFSGLPTDVAQRRAFLAQFRPSRVWDVFPAYDEITQSDVQQILQGKDPFQPDTFAFRVVAGKNYEPESNLQTSFGRRVDEPLPDPLAYASDLRNAFPLQRVLITGSEEDARRSREDALAELRGIDGGAPFRRGRQNMLADVYESDADLLDAVLRTGGSIDEAAIKLMGTGTRTGLSEVYLTPENTPAGLLPRAGGAIFGKDFVSEGVSDLSIEEKRKLAEQLGQYETAEDLANRMSQSRGSMGRLAEMRERGIISDEEYNRRIARSMGIPNVRPGQRPEPQAAEPAPTTATPTPTTPATPTPRAEEPTMQSQPEPTPQARPQTEIQRTQLPKRYRNPLTGEFMQ